MPAGQEIERKFLVSEVPSDAGLDAGEELRQGYLALDGGTEVRLRFESGGAWLTIKHGGGRVRVEESLAVEPRQAEALWALTEGRRVEKLRRRTELDGLVVELDVYAGALEGLLVAEVEFADEAAADAFRPPAWFGDEVTEDERYKNRTLACDGRPGGRD